MGESLVSVISKFYESYVNSTPRKLKIVDAYLFYILITGIIQFVYCCLVGTFPFNSFLSGFVSCVGSFVLGGKIYFKLCLYFKFVSTIARGHVGVAIHSGFIHFQFDVNLFHF